MSLFRPLLPPAISVAEMDPRAAAFAELPAAEQAGLGPHAVEKRRREYAAGRLLARGLLTGLGAPPDFALLAAPDRAPAWPPDYVGSITHCDTWAAVVVARAGACAGVGIDVEPTGALPEGVERLVLSPEEGARLDEAWAGAERGLAGRLVFSAKEAIYKATYPETRLYLDFSDVDMALGPDGTLVATLRRAAPPYPRGKRFFGRWRVAEGHLGTAFVVP